jgi:hypothetical protein
MSSRLSSANRRAFDNDELYILPSAEQQNPEQPLCGFPQAQGVSGPDVVLNLWNHACEYLSLRNLGYRLTKKHFTPGSVFTSYSDGTVMTVAQLTGVWQGMRMFRECGGNVDAILRVKRERLQPSLNCVYACIHGAYRGKRDRPPTVIELAAVEATLAQVCCQPLCGLEFLLHVEMWTIVAVRLVGLEPLRDLVEAIQLRKNALREASNAIYAGDSEDSVVDADIVAGARMAWFDWVNGVWDRVGIVRSVFMCEFAYSPLEERWAAFDCWEGSRRSPRSIGGDADIVDVSRDISDR